MQNGNGRNRYDYLAVVIVSTVEIKQLVLENVDDVVPVFCGCRKVSCMVTFFAELYPAQEPGSEVIPHPGLTISYVIFVNKNLHSIGST